MLFGKVEITKSTRYKSYYCAVVNQYSTANYKLFETEKELIKDIIDGGYLDVVMKECGFEKLDTDEPIVYKSDLMEYLSKCENDFHRYANVCYDITEYIIKFNIYNLEIGK